MNPPNDMAGACINAPDEPGLLIWHCGRADFSGGMTFRGIIYVVNNSDGTCPASLPARGDDAEAGRLRDSCPRTSYTGPDVECDDRV